MSGSSSTFQVFLGGSCNPTTWRDDIAIPYFKQHNITFYNPQANSWGPELMEIEDQAKEMADLLLFVIDNQTRSVSSIVEAAYVAGCGRQLILVIKPLGCQVTVAGEVLLDGEAEDLQLSHMYLTDLVEHMSIPVFTDIDKALECTRIALEMNTNVRDLKLEDGAQVVKHPQLRVTHELIKMKEVFTDLDTTHCGRLTYIDVCHAYKTITGYDLPEESLTVTDGNCNCHSADLPNGVLHPLTLTFDEFCCLVSEYRYKTLPNQSLFQWLLDNICKLLKRSVEWLTSWLQPKDFVVDKEQQLGHRDVYLGGSCGQSSWRLDIAVPLLRKHGLSFYSPQLTGGGWKDCFSAIEHAMKETCRVLLFVITSDTRSIRNMLEAAHYIGRGCNTVLCVENIQYGACIDTELPSRAAIDDYNRARAYLADIANRDGVPVLSDIREAVLCAISRLHLT
jgi:hypothetical protein